MKKVFKATALLLALLAAFAFVGCSNSSGSGGGDSDWQNVVNMSDLVGSWVYNSSDQGLKSTETYSVASDFSTSVKAVVDYSAADPMVQATMPLVVLVLEAAGYACNNDIAAKELTATRSFTSSDFRTFVLGGGVKINSAKDKVKMKDAQGKKEVIFSKQ